MHGDYGDYEVGYGWTCSCGITSFITFIEKDSAKETLAKHVREKHANDWDSVDVELCEEWFEKEIEVDDDYYDEEDGEF